MTGQPSEEITCRDVVELITDYLEGSMPSEQRLRFEQHLAFCFSCVEYLDQMRQTIRAMGAIKEDDLDPELRDAMLRVFREFTP
jgi:anti-sigma factor RsiW